ETCPVFTGYNRLKAKPNAEVIAKVQEFGDPFVVVGTYGKGKSMAFASDVAPHWGAGFMKWPGYDRFWVQAIRWLGTK
ncbi:MAG: glutamine amidotransferase, partial [Candidatus Neomarinimicrobiota bacterium]